MAKASIFLVALHTIYIGYIDKKALDNLDKLETITRGKNASN